MPLAITLEDEERGCVAGIDRHGRWFRPSPIPAAWVRDAKDLFSYRVWSMVQLAPHPSSKRPEDRLIEGLPVYHSSIEPADYAHLLATTVDPHVKAGLSPPRSAALVRAQILNLYACRHTRGRIFLRVVFTDATGELFDWIIPEIATNCLVTPHILNGAIDPAFVSSWLKALNKCNVYLALGLTLPRARPDDRFGGCQPLVVGIHPLPRSHALQRYGSEC